MKRYDLPNTKVISYKIFLMIDMKPKGSHLGQSQQKQMNNQLIRAQSKTMQTDS